MYNSANINDKYKISKDMNLLKRLISFGYSVAFNAAATPEEEEFLLTRKDKSKTELQYEFKELKNLLR